jgi:trans-aconitate methyltransferase
MTKEQTEMSSPNYDLIWSDKWGDMQRFGPVHRHHRRIFGELLGALSLTEIDTVADIGCGEGSNLLYLRDLFPGSKLHGFDVSETALEKARSRIDATYAILDVQRAHSADSFDLTICSDVLEHLNDDVVAIRNIQHMTNRFALFATVQGRMRRNEGSIGHVRNYGRGELQRKLASNGFQITRAVEWGYPFYSPLYRDLVSVSAAEKASYGRYGFGKRFLCNLLYAAFFLNRSDKGDIIFVLARKNAGL